MSGCVLRATSYVLRATTCYGILPCPVGAATGSHPSHSTHGIEGTHTTPPTPHPLPSFPIQEGRKYPALTPPPPPTHTHPLPPHLLQARSRGTCLLRSCRSATSSPRRAAASAQRERALCARAPLATATACLRRCGDSRRCMVRGRDEGAGVGRGGGVRAGAGPPWPTCTAGGRDQSEEGACGRRQAYGYGASARAFGLSRRSGVSLL
jgi:hypothetical protein